MADIDSDEEVERIKDELDEVQEVITKAGVVDEEAIYEQCLKKKKGKREGNDDIVEDPNPRDTPEKEILWAAERGKIDIVKRLLEENRALTNARDSDGYTPLHRACYANKVDVVKVLLEYGADVTARTCDDWTPLHSACKWNNYQCAALLLIHGADVNPQTDGGQTPLHLASTHPEAKHTLLLLLRNPQTMVNIRNNSGELPSDIAHRHCKYYKLFELAEPCLNEI